LVEKVKYNFLNEKRNEKQTHNSFHNSGNIRIVASFIYFMKNKFKKIKNVQSVSTANLFLSIISHTDRRWWVTTFYVNVSTWRIKVNPSVYLTFELKTC